MSDAPEDVTPLANLPVPHSAVLNIGTVRTQLFEAYRQTLFEYNKAGWPIVLDPVGAGATPFRTQASLKCLENGYVDVIKGNHSEIMALAGWKGGKSRGVDSVGSGSLQDRCAVAQFLAERERMDIVV
jgi:hydroxyethylthiazole kinase-like sugar kinase family protein